MDRIGEVGSPISPVWTVDGGEAKFFRPSIPRRGCQQDCMEVVADFMDLCARVPSLRRLGMGMIGRADWPAVDWLVESWVQYECAYGFIYLCPLRRCETSSSVTKGKRDRIRKRLLPYQADILRLLQSRNPKVQSLRSVVDLTVTGIHHQHDGSDFREKRHRV
jgi:hypothetical protein